jgi:hypothetical protein
VRTDAAEQAGQGEQKPSVIIAAVQELQELQRSARALPPRSTERAAAERRIADQQRRVWAMSTDADGATAAGD